MSEWQPIATAPNATKVLLRGESSHGGAVVVIAHFIERFTEEAYSESDWFEWGENEDTAWVPEGWYEQTYTADEYASMHLHPNEFTPTHWMPLPEPPQ